MLRIHQSNSADGAKSYYAASDYYLAGNDQELVGEWQGRGAAMLGLEGSIAKDDFDKLCDNLSPADGQPLTLATRDSRRVGYDFNFNAPKSLSVLYGLTKDESLLQAFRDAVRETMADVESEMKTRVRKEGSQHDRVVGNMICAEFVHFTARPVDGVPDPSLHAHMFVFNAVHDPVEKEWKAGQFAGVKRDANYFEALFHSRLAGKLRDQGFGIVRQGRHWELDGIDRSVIEKFSRRTAQIEAKAKSKGITHADDKAGLGAKTRESKQKNMSWAELQAWWREQLSNDQQERLAGVYARSTPPRETNKVSARESLRHAADHHLERSAVVRERAILETALRYGVGSTDLTSIRGQYEHEGILTREHDEDRLATSRGVLAEEQVMLAFARDGRCRSQPLNPSHQLTRDWLNADQQAAVRHVLNSTDRVMMISGSAGTGKSTLTLEALEAIDAAGIRRQVVAPTTPACEVLKRDGVEDVVTLQRLLINPKLHEFIRDGVLWIDEAGLVSSRDMAKAFALAKDQNARVVLTGDIAQHKSVARGESLRLLETEAGLQPARVRDIVRQSGDYKSAVQDFASGSVGSGFDKLDTLGWVTEGDDQLRYLLLARDYADAAQAKTGSLVSGMKTKQTEKLKDVMRKTMKDKLLVVSPTHAEADRTTATIREVLRSRGIIGKTSQAVERLAATNWTEAQRADAAQYRDTSGLVVQFVQNAKGFKRGTRGEVVGVANNAVTIRTADTLTQLPLAQASRFQVYRKESLELATGDLVRITANGKTADGHALNNGAVYNVAKVTRSGAVTLDNGWTLDRHWGHLAPGYVVTSHASQGRTVDHVFVAASAESSPAVNQAMAYVSTSRGRESVRIYTDNKESLREAMTRGTTTLTATELLLPPWWQRTGSHLQRRSQRLAAYRAGTMDKSQAAVAKQDQGAAL